MIWLESNGIEVVSEANFDMLAEKRLMLVAAMSQFCTAGEASTQATDTFLSLKHELVGNLDFGWLDVDQQPFVAVKWQLDQVPSLLVVRRDKVIARFGYDEPGLVEKIKSLLALIMKGW